MHKRAHSTAWVLIDTHRQHLHAQTRAWEFWVFIDTLNKFDHLRAQTRA